MKDFLFTFLFSLLSVSVFSNSTGDIDSALVEGVNFKFYLPFNPTSIQCSKDGKTGLKILGDHGFSRSTVLPGLPFCALTGNVEIIFKNKKDSRKFDLLCDRLLEDKKTGKSTYYKLSKVLLAEVCDVN